MGCFLFFFFFSQYEVWPLMYFRCTSAFSVLQVLDYRIFVGSKREELIQEVSEAASACTVQCFSRHAFKKVFKDKPVVINKSWGFLLALHKEEQDGEMHRNILMETKLD